MGSPKVIYITGFHQHAGKTVASLGIIALLKKYIPLEKIGYFKPVGQELVSLPNGEMIDKDAMIIKTFSGIPDLDLSAISPVRLGSGFTKKFLDTPNQEAQILKLRESILHSLESMEDKQIIIAEGTGHPGVGGIVGLSNAKVSNLMRAEIIYLSGGGIGRALDMLEVDLSYFLFKKSRVRGIIFTKCIPDKIDQMQRYITEEMLNQKFGAVGGTLKIFGFLPSVERLAYPSMHFIFSRWPGAEAIGDPESANWQSPCNQIKVLSMPYADLRRKDFLGAGNLLIMSAVYQKRIRSILKFNKTLNEKSQALGGIILTSGKFVPLERQTIIEIKKSLLPAIYVPEHTANSEELLLDLYQNTKLQVYDNLKYSEIEQLYAQYFNMESFLEAFDIKV